MVLSFYTLCIVLQYKMYLLWTVDVKAIKSTVLLSHIVW